MMKDTILKKIPNYLFFIFSYLVLSKFLVLIFLLLNQSSKYNTGIMVFGTAVSLFGLKVFIYFWKKLALGKEFGEHDSSLKKKGIGILVAFVALISASFLLYLMNPISIGENETLSKIIDTNKHMFVFYLFRTILIVPIYEEVLFRGVILGLEKKYLNTLTLDSKKKSAALAGCILLNSIIFAYLHHANSIVTFFVFLFFGVISSCLVLYTKDLKCSILLHQLNNLFSILSSLG